MYVHGLNCVQVLAVSAAGRGHRVKTKKVKAFHTRYQALGPELIPV